MKIKDAINWLNSTDTTSTPPLSVDGVLKLQKAIIAIQAELLEEAKAELYEAKLSTHNGAMRIKAFLIKLTEAEV